MARLPSKANTEGNNERMSSFDVIPEGEYTLVITSSKWKKTKDGTGHYIEIMMVVSEGEKTGSLLITRLNLDNKNPDAVQIAKKELNSICYACGAEDVEDTDELHQIPFRAYITVEEREGQRAQNRVSRYIELDEGSEEDVEEGLQGIPDSIKEEPPKEKKATKKKKEPEPEEDDEEDEKMPWDD